MIYNYATFMEVEIVHKFWAFITTEVLCCISETKFDGNVITHVKWEKENRIEANFGATLTSSSRKDCFRGLLPEIYRDFS